MYFLELLVRAVAFEEDNVVDAAIAGRDRLIEPEEAAQVELALGLDPAGIERITRELAWATCRPSCRH